MYLAVETGHQAVAESLICYGANLSTATYSGATPASLCSAAELAGPVSSTQERPFGRRDESTTR